MRENAVLQIPNAFHVEPLTPCDIGAIQPSPYFPGHDILRVVYNRYA